MKKIQLLLLCTLISLSLFAQSTGKKIEYFLPKGDFTYNSKVPKPSQELEYEIGDYHVTTGELYDYFEKLQSVSDRFKVEYHGKSHENRKILYATVTSKSNHDNIGKILANHHKLSDPTYKGKIDYDSMPIVIWLGYNIHGNEASAVNSTLAVSYFLAAAEGKEIDNILENSVIIIHPAINPDGTDKFANWVNFNRSDINMLDPETREFNEPWPSSRANHYWFDLNRDLLYLQHPESRSKVEMYMKWLPNILNDHHEHRSNNNFFFMPGAKSRTNTITHKDNWELTNKVSKYHAKGLDQIGTNYFAEQSFDDFYYGKGSTFPDIHGTIGMLFEQGSSRGLIRMTKNGVLTLAMGTRNQAYVSYSTIRAAMAMKDELLRHQRESYTTAYQESQSKKFAGYVVGSDDSKGINSHFINILLAQKIDVYKLNKSFNRDGNNYTTKNSYFIPVTQKETRKINTIFENMTQFQDSVFYALSAWTLTEAANIEMSKVKNDMRGEKVSSIALEDGEIIGGEASYAYIIEPKEYYSYKVIYALQKAGLNLKASTKKFSFEVAGKSKIFRYGTIIVPVNHQPISKSEIYSLIKKVTKNSEVNVYSTNSGTMTDTYLGSADFKHIYTPKTAMIVGSGASSLLSGEAWFLLDKRIHMPLAKLDETRITSESLRNYNTLIVTGVNGLTKGARKAITSWTRNGGVIIALGEGWKLTNKLGLTDLTLTKNEYIDHNKNKTYASQSNETAGQAVGGVILDTYIDISHPLCWGYDQKTISMLRKGVDVFNEIGDEYNTPLRFTENPSISGYISKDNIKNLAGTSAAVVGSAGKGKVVVFNSEPNSMGFWFGTQKLFYNALFFAPLISAKPLVSIEKAE